VHSYRNPELLADMPHVDHISGGRLILGIGSGWFERDYDRVRLRVRHRAGRLADLGAALPRIESRWGKLTRRRPGRSRC